MTIPQQLKTLHFWLVIVAAVLACLNKTGIIPAVGPIHDVVYYISAALAAGGYQLAYKDTPVAKS